MHRRSLLVSLSLGIPLAAQTFVVDAAGGAGAAFTSIAVAAAAVPDGAVLFVQPGIYASFTIDGKSLTVIGGPGVVVEELIGSVSVKNLTAAQSVTMHGIELHSTLSPGLFSCDSCAGAVVLQDCRAVPAGGGGITGGLLVNGTPINGQDAYVDQNPSYPKADKVTLDFGIGSALGRALVSRGATGAASRTPRTPAAWMSWAAPRPIL